MQQPDSRRNDTKRIDQFGIGLAGLCAVHCLAAIIVVMGLGAGGHFLLAPELHRFGLALALIIAAATIGWGAIRHRRALPIGVAVVGLTFMSAAIAVPHGYNEFVLTLIGVSLVALGHFLNLRTTTPTR